MASYVFLQFIAIVCSMSAIYFSDVEARETGFNHVSNNFKVGAFGCGATIGSQALVWLYLTAFTPAIASPAATAATPATAATAAK